LVVIGLNHRTAPLDLLERMSIDDSRLTKALADLVEPSPRHRGRHPVDV
jgi:glutamyl-tRNA reductase